MNKLAGRVLLLLLCWNASGGICFAETRDDHFGTDDIFVSNFMEAAKSEFYCANYKLSEELRMASAEMMQADVRAQGKSGSTFKYSADVFVTKKKLELEMLDYFRRPDQKPSCEEIKVSCVRQLIETQKKIIELIDFVLKKAAGNAITPRGQRNPATSEREYTKGYRAGCAAGNDTTGNPAHRPPDPSKGTDYALGWMKGLGNCAQTAWDNKTREIERDM